MTEYSRTYTSSQIAEAAVASLRSKGLSEDSVMLVAPGPGTGGWTVRVRPPFGTGSLVLEILDRFDPIATEVQGESRVSPGVETIHELSKPVSSGAIHELSKRVSPGSIHELSKSVSPGAISRLSGRVSPGAISRLSRSTDPGVISRLSGPVARGSIARLSGPADPGAVSRLSK
jgi:hypothetical protein